MNNDIFKNLWFQDKLYKPQHFGKLVYAWGEIVEKDNCPEKVITKIRCEEWDGESLDNKDNATFIEAINKEGDIVFIYNADANMLATPNAVFHFVGNDLNNILKTTLGDSVKDFYKGAKLKDYKFRKAKEKFIKDYLFDYNGQNYYAVKKKFITYEEYYGNTKLQCQDIEYTLYDGKFLITVLVDGFAGNSKVTDKRKCKLSDIDKKLKKFNIKL